MGEEGGRSSVPADVPVRLVALIIDAGIVGVFWLAIASVGAALGPIPVLGMIVWIALALSGGVASVGYLPFCYWRYQASLGKSIVGVKVVDQATGRELPPDRAVIRGVVQTFISGVFFGFGYWWLFLDPDRQTLHDRMAGSSVVLLGEDERPPYQAMLSDLRRLFTGSRRTDGPPPRS